MKQLIGFSIRNKFLVLLLTFGIIAFGVRGLTQLSVGAVPDVTNNQIQILTTSRSLSTTDVEKFLTLPIELEIANLPGVQEIRSTSKFGLSVVTVVFDESLGTYLPRQLVAERLPSINERIPEGFGTPIIGPITTGLGELLQYTLEVDPAYSDWYSLTDLRTIHDWIVVRKLSGIEGVVEVNTWGGFLKQIEVAVDPLKLQAYDLDLDQVYSALTAHSGIASGAYIEKNNQAYYIRADGQSSSFKEIANTLIEYKAQTPIYIRDVAEVNVGHAPRFGAVTANGKGERVMGQLMLLKGADESATLEAIQKRIDEVSNQLPEGIYINPFLDRSELVGKTSFTVAENLILGCLIVIFVVIVLLGNWRSGLVVASVIPLSLLFALGMMNVFGVDANLLSLGAIDFGIIIDGAVIIVDFVTFYMVAKAPELASLERSDRQQRIDTLVAEGTHKMMHSAIFGQLIILIVFIPIFSLSGVEGKMFGPMAKVFSFALIGAMLLCFTYVPVLSSWLIRPVDNLFSRASKRLFIVLNRFYQPLLAHALRNIRWVFGLSIILWLMAVLLFSRMGGEFAPTLDEGDFVIQPVLKTGTSLSRTVEITTQIEQILLEFPEVNQAVSRIGAAEVPTDPMSMEEADVIIKLNPRNSWTTAPTKDGLADAFKSRILEELPSIEVEFTQPIEMRFNELITGVRTDLAIKLFGEDLDILAAKGAEIAHLIEDVSGASDISVEKIEGLPQLRITYNREALAAYGISVAEVNQLINTAYAGRSAGVFYEGERSFDLVVRYPEAIRNDLQQLNALTLNGKGSVAVPLSSLATIEQVASPAKISRETGRRRVVVGVNVRNRDLGSVVDDVQQLLSDQLKLPPGYYLEYGGQFENLQSASKRLMIAVPLSLLLILAMLYMAFRSLKEAFMIFSAIPLAAVGGVYFLALRGLPFSISAGVGFIALFGIAVLNGLVLIEEFRSLEQQGFTNILRRVITGTVSRIRPVLLTALAAALGFLPMAVSVSSGSEVQRPLATVVIGGLISATLLTLIVLPCLYYVLYSRASTMKKLTIKRGALTILITVLSTVSVFAQGSSDSIARYNRDELLSRALVHHPLVRAEKHYLAAADANRNAVFSLEKTAVYRQYDQNNITESGQALEVFGISQNFSFPTVYAARKKWLDASLENANWKLWAAQNKALASTSRAFYTYMYADQMLQINQQKLVYYQRFVDMARRKITLGESTKLELLTAQTVLKQNQNELINYTQQRALALDELQRFTGVEWLNPIYDYDKELFEAEVDLESIRALIQSEVSMAQGELKLAKSNFAPDVSVNVFRGVDPLASDKNYDGIQLGLSVPLFYGAQKSQLKVAQSKLSAIRIQSDDKIAQLEAEFETLVELTRAESVWLDQFESEMQDTFDSVLKIAMRSYETGNLSFSDFVSLINQAYQLRAQYLERFLSYHLHVSQLKFPTL